MRFVRQPARFSGIIAAALMLVQPALGAVRFDGIAAGDATSSAAILWTRADNGGQTAALTAEVSDDPAFGRGVRRFAGTTSAASDFTLKLDATGLAPNTVYYYRFTDGSTSSPTGRFTTPPAGNEAVPVRLGFSGDVDARFRPFPSVDGFGTTAGGSRDLNYFIFLGDTMYETAAMGSPATAAAATDGSNAADVLRDYYRKYREVLQGVDPATGAMSDQGQQGVRAMMAATGQYTLLDNHELGNKQLQAGGAPQAAKAKNNPVSFDVNTTGTYNNKSPGFQALMRAYLDYHPIREAMVSAPADPRSDGTQRLYFATQWGKNSILINLDDRSYRDIRLQTEAGKDDIGLGPDGHPNPSARADNPGRTMLGATQLAWLKQVLLKAKSDGIVWKILVMSTPIDTVGGNQDGKSWYGGYRSERNDIMKFVAENGIDHVVVLTTDDHEMRTTPLLYVADPSKDPDRKVMVPGAFQIVTGPIGAAGPHKITDHRFETTLALLNSASTKVANNPDLIAHGDPPIGLVGFPGLTNVWRDGHPDAASNPKSIDFFAPDRNGYTTLEIDARGNLTVATWGIPSYQPDTFPQPKAPSELIMRFGITVE